MLRKRRKTKTLKIKDVFIGSDYPIVIQSMTNTPTKKTKKTIQQIINLKNCGAQIVRLAVLDIEDAEKLFEIIEKTNVPLVADIHFDHRLALKALDSGIHGLRLNPGNIKEKSKIKEIVEKAKKLNIPIRIGVNSGSLNFEKFPNANAQDMVISALDHIRILEDLKFDNIKVSLKSSDIHKMIEANVLFSKERDYPIHLGVTEAGIQLMSAVRSSIGIGNLLMQGIGDTIRVSASGDPAKELDIAREILLSLGLKKGIKWISCPTCGRTEVDVEKIVLKLSGLFSHIDKNVKVAVMGCIVNGPGEARDADIALVSSKKHSLIYLKGNMTQKVKNNEIEKKLKKVILSYLENKSLE